MVLDDPTKIALSEPAIIKPVISPPGGHGSDIARELGASNLMLSVDIEGSEGDILPLDNADVHGIRQVGMLLDPLLTDYTYASESVYRTTTKFILTVPNSNFIHKQVVYSGTSLATATFSGIVEHYDSVRNYLYVTSINGVPVKNVSVYGVDPTTGNENAVIASILEIEDSKIKKYSGKLLYIEDTSELQRTLDQITRFKFILRF